MGDETEIGGTEGEWAAPTERPIDRELSTRGPSTDVAFDLLSKSHRRFTLYCLDRQDGGIDLPQLVERITRLFEDSQASTPLEYDHLRTRLAHTTLPRLDDAGVVIYDHEAGVIWPTEAIDSMEPLLAVSAKFDFAEPAAIEGFATK